MEVGRSLGFQLGNRYGSVYIIKKYRCVYCKRIIGTDPTKIPQHEAMCDARLVVERQWAVNLAKAKRREKQRLEGINVKKIGEASGGGEDKEARTNHKAFGGGTFRES